MTLVEACQQGVEQLTSPFWKRVELERGKPPSYLEITYPRNPETGDLLINDKGYVVHGPWVTLHMGGETRDLLITDPGLAGDQWEIRATV